MEKDNRVDILIKNGLILTMDAHRSVIRGGDVAILDDRIMALGQNLPYEADKIIDGSNSVVAPGLVNAHMHETLTRGIAEDLPLNRWLSEICFPLDSAYTAEVMTASAQMSQFEMISAGTTTFLDIYRFPEACAQVAEKSGLRAIFAPQVIIEPQGPGESIAAAEEFVSNWQIRNPRITPAFGPHAPYSCPPEAYLRLAELAEQYNVPLHTHLAETQWEVDTLRERYGVDTPTRLLADLGLLTPRLSVAHGVHLTREDIEMLARAGTSVIYNPSSNMKLASGVAPIPELVQAGVNVGLGTDSNLSNNNLDLFEEMRIGAVLQKLHRSDAAAMPCHTMLEMATIAGARALGMDDYIGSIEIGKQADVILLNLNRPHLWPLLDGRYFNPVEQIVYSANAADVTHTIVAGQLLMEDRCVMTLELDEVRTAVMTATRKLLNDAGMHHSHLLKFGNSMEWN